ncbi:hypothetical protein DFH11DRAFT_988750 [Phellopilus nigrolimitatus]|nr:hypothetical protein DFH11DRAFT_988750 [Phellopilus nigrolimitatus]
MPVSPKAGYQSPFVDGTAYHFGVGERPRTLCELAMTRLSAELRSEQGWWLRFQNQEMRQKWIQEAANKTWRVGPISNNIKVGLAKHQIEYVVDELAGYAALRNDGNGVQVSCFDRIWESDQLLDNVELEKLRGCVDSLRVSGRFSTLDILVDPLRHSYISGRSIARAGVDARIDSSSDYCTSARFTALPTIVRVHSNDTRVEYQSYVNGIDPAQSEIHEALLTALGRSINLFENVLTTLHRSNPLPQRIRNSYRYRVWDEPDPPEDSEDDDAWEQHQRDVRQWALYRPIEIPDVPTDGYSDEFMRLAHKVRFRDGKTIQIIHRIVDITLNEERRKVENSVWQVAGMKNERIVACALHFVSVRGIDSGQLDFRMAVTSPSNFVPHDVGATLRTWGLQSGDGCNQHLGSVPLRSGLSIAFPNIYQHRIRHVQLREDCKEGRFTVVEFYLVDPDMPPIISTADVAPQQRDWIYLALESSVDRRLPPELLERIVDMVDNVLTDEEADKYRVEMETERVLFTADNTERYFSLPFDIDVAL